MSQFRKGQKLVVIEKANGIDFSSNGRTVGSIVEFIEIIDSYSEFICLCSTPNAPTETWCFSPNQLRPLTPLEQLL